MSPLPDYSIKRWIIVLDDGSQTKSAKGASMATSLRCFVYLYPDGTGRLKIVDRDSDTLIVDDEFSGWSWSDMEFAKIKLGCKADDTGQRHMYIKEVRTW